MHSSAPVGITLDRVSVDYPLFETNVQMLQGRVLNALSSRRRRPGLDSARAVNALKNISLQLQPGNAIGLIGRNGAGKSTLLKLMAGVIEPTRGRIVRSGRVHALFSIGSGMETNLDGFQNIRRIGLLRGFSRQEIESMMPDILAFADIGDFIERPLRTYSSGMRVRLAFAMATIGAPDILLVDEIFGAGDKAFQRRAEDRIRGLLSRSSIVAFSSHSQALLRTFCTECLYLEDGRVKARGDIDEVLGLYDADIRAGREAAI